LLAVIRQKQTAIAKLQAELDEARAALGAGSPRLLHPVRRVPPGIKLPGKARGHRSVHSGSGPQAIVPGSAADLAAQAIKAAGRPLHATDLVKAIEQGGRKIKLTTLVGSLSRWVKKRSVFYRARKNTFGLIEMRKG
jgi:hypothetical protein